MGRAKDEYSYKCKNCNSKFQGASFHSCGSDAEWVELDDEDD